MMWDFIQTQILGMKWLNILIGALLSALGLDITDMEKIMGFGVMSMPALMIDGKVVSAGKVLKAKEVEKFL